jgi:sulfopyruvate decarboxylase subunit alpha
MKQEFIVDFLSSLEIGGINFVSGLPDSWLRNVIEAIEKDPRFTYVPVCNEGVGFSICAGAWFGGKKPALIMESSGLRVAAESIARLNFHLGGGGGGHGIGALIITSYRGDIGDTEFWSIPHAMTLEPLLTTLRIPYLIVRDARDLKKSVVRVSRAAFRFMNPAALVISGDLAMED